MKKKKQAENMHYPSGPTHLLILLERSSLLLLAFYSIRIYDIHPSNTVKKRQACRYESAQKKHNRRLLRFFFDQINNFTNRRTYQRVSLSSSSSSLSSLSTKSSLLKSRPTPNTSDTGRFEASLSITTFF